MQIFVNNSQGNTTTTLKVEKNETISTVKRKLKEKKGMSGDMRLILIYNETLLQDGHTLAHYGILNESTLSLFLRLDAHDVVPCILSIRTWNQIIFFLEVKREDSIDDVKARIQERFGIPSHKQLLFYCGKLLEDGSRTIDDYNIPNNGDLDLEQEIAQNKEKELEATISELKAENKKNEQELTIARNKEKELDATICALMHKTKLFSDQCASYESLVDDLEVENKKTKEELMNADKKYYAGLKEAKAKWLKSVEFLHHLADASMRYFNHGFDSCQKQAEEQGFCGQLNKGCALKDAPDLRELESSDQPH